MICRHSVANEHGAQVAIIASEADVDSAWISRESQWGENLPEEDVPCTRSLLETIIESFDKSVYFLLSPVSKTLSSRKSEKYTCPSSHGTFGVLCAPPAHTSATASLLGPSVSAFHMYVGSA